MSNEKEILSNDLQNAMKRSTKQNEEPHVDESQF